ncbi:hypothetical protein ABZ369_06555 [Streptomyces sp. NPDC005918]|uniref:hypothetical protein n=1 Tax=Streptomyces sp. NPDC005918 TaxID=3155454 RepID=UPI0033CF9926
MTAYSDAYRVLTSGRALKPAEAARLLARVHDEHAADLADVIRTEAKQRCAPNKADTKAVARRKTRRFGAMTSAASLIDPALGAAPKIPSQRDRSTS